MSLQIELRVARGSFLVKMACLAGFLLLFLPGFAQGTVHQASDPNLWEEVLQEFKAELTPDQVTPGTSAIDIYGYKYLEMVGVIDHSALVIVGQRPAKEVSKDNAWNVYYSAFSLDLATRRKTSIERTEKL